MPLSDARTLLPRIPCQPLSAADAAPFLSNLTGPAADAAWQGGLPFAYRVGRGPIAARLEVHVDTAPGVLHDVLGRIEGAVEPDKVTLLKKKIDD